MMLRACMLALATTAVLPSVALAEHPGRPPNLPPLGSASLWFIDERGAVSAIERGAPGSVDIFVYGWTFDSSVPDSPFVTTSPADTRTNEGLSDTHWAYAYNLSTFTYDQVNVELLRLAPNAPIGPRRLAMFDFSTLKVTNSLLKTELIAASDFSKVQISNTQLTGELRMQSGSTMTLSQVSALRRPGETNTLNLIAERGTTDVAFSTLENIAARDRASVTVTDSIIRGRVSNDRIDLPTSNGPFTTLVETEVGSLSASIGFVSMKGGRVKGVVSASGTPEDPLRPGSIILNGVAVEGSVTAAKFGSILHVGGAIQGSLTVGDASNAPAEVNISGVDVSGSVRAVGRGDLKISLFQSIGALQASGDSRVDIASGKTILGGVLATGQSQVSISFVERIEGDAFANHGAVLRLGNTSANVVGAFSNSALSVTSSRVLSVTANGGDVELQGVKVSDQIVAFGKSRLTFSHSEVDHNITNVGDGTGLVQVDSGIVGGDLVGLGSSVTAMSGGLVRGAPVFGDQATFLYSGGTFQFISNPAPAPGDVIAALHSSDDASPLDLLSTASGFTARGSATIRFIGFGLQSTLVEAEHLEGDFSYSVYRLSGQLADHTRINGGLVFVQKAAGTARFELVEAPPVPEPSTVALWILGLSSLAWSGCARRGTPGGLPEPQPASAR